MIDKSKWRATAEKHGNIVVVHFTGGGECLWLNMYLDMEQWQMTCDSDIGVYTYCWGKRGDSQVSFLDFCCRWMSNEEWLLRKCIGEKLKKQFFGERAAENLREMVEELHEDDEFFSPFDLDDILDKAVGYSDNASAWFAVVWCLADEKGLELPEEWYCCGEYDYSAWQKLFAEICAKSIVPELKRLMATGHDPD